MLNNYYENMDEKPLDRICENGGATAIFRSIACIGDSLASGEFQLTEKDGKWSYHDMYEYSWGQFIARMIGSKVYNFSRGGMTAKWYCDSFADENGFWDKEKAAQCYIMALGVNDVTQIIQQKLQFGSISDIADNYLENKETFVGYYSRIIARYKEISPYAKFFLVTCPKCCEREELYDMHSKLIYEIADHFDNTYVIDLRKYGAEYDADFKKAYYLCGHMSPTGYLYTAKIISSYIDYIIRNNPNDFKTVGLINTELQNKIKDISLNISNACLMGEV